jgi:small-conductance mechanosensitive channel
MVDTFIRDISREDIIRLAVFLVIIIVGNWLIKRVAKFSAAKDSRFFQRSLPIIDSLADWVTFYGIIILLLLTFSKNEWLFEPLYTHGEVKVTILLIVIAFLIVSLAHRLVKLFNRYILSSVYDYYGVDRGLGYTFNQIIYYTVMFAALAVSLTSVGINLTAIGAVFGVLGIGIGFGMRNVAGNFVSGIIILFERPIEVGEIIQINDKVGRVENIRLRSTIIRTAKEGTLIVPNQYFIEQIVKNRTSAKMMAQIKVSVAFGTDTHLVQSLLEKAVHEIKENEEGILDSPEPDIRFIDFHSRAMEFLIEIPVVNFEIKEKIESKLRHMVAAIFVEKNIQLPAVTFQMSDDNNLYTSERTE